MLSPEVNRNYAKITRRKKWRTKVRNRNRISFALRNVGSGGVQFRSRHFCTAKNKLIRMQLAFRKVDIDILSLNFVIYVVNGVCGREMLRKPLSRKTKINETEV